MPGTVARVVRAARGTAMRLTHTPGWVEGALLALLWAIVLVRMVSAVHWP